jgi:antitoxin (DNA-binding transcriptional repressor) of toxin-antitoxin stability system
MDAIMKVGIREFREHLPQYLMTTTPVAVTKHGETIGFYIPARHHHDKADLDALKKAALNLEKLLLSSGVTEEELFEEFRALKKR